MLNIEIDYDALSSNLSKLRERVSCRFCAVVKADAYGHGMKGAARVFARYADCFAVACSEEALELRESVRSTPILHLGCPDERLLTRLSKEGVTLSVNCHEDMEILIKSGLSFDVHIKADSGMHRLGFHTDGLADAVAQIENADNLRCAGIYTHFARADRDDCEEQHNTFLRALSGIGGNRIIHCANSSAALLSRRYHHDMVRCGLACYGYAECRTESLELSPVMSAFSTIAQVKDVSAGEYIGYGDSFRASRDMRVAIIACGYADGIPRTLSNSGYVVLGGKRCAIVGNICMDMLTVDVSGLDAAKGGRAYIITEGHDVSDLAKEAGTIPYEILTGFTCRARRTGID